MGLGLFRGPGRTGLQREGSSGPVWLKGGHCLGLGNELEFGEGLIPVGLEKPEEGGLFSFAYLKKHTLLPTKMIGVGFPDSSVGRESVCNAGDPGSIPRLGRSTGKGLGYPPQYSWASLWAQLVKNLPAMQETWFYPWVGKIPWRRERYLLQYSGLENSMDYI